MSEKGARQFSPADTSFIGMIESSIKRSWDMVAYSDYGTDISYTYGDVAKMIAALHCLYKDLGIKAGDKIALCDKNSSNWAISYMSILTYGAVVVPILSDFNQEQIEHIYEHSDAKLMIGREGVSVSPLLDIGSWKLSNSRRCVLDYDVKSLTAEKVRYGREKSEDLALISYTSGSTGHSKGVMLPYRSLWSNVHFADEVLGLTRGCNTIALLPMAHMYGMAFDFLYEFCIGCHVHFLTKTPSPAIIIKAFGEVKPKLVIAVPLIIEKIVQGKIFPILRTRKIRLLMKIPFMKGIIYKRIREQLINVFGGEFYEVIVGGAAFNKDVENFLADIHFPYMVGYGMTECGPIIGYEDWKRFVKGSCGKAAPRMEVKIDSQDPSDVAGEILARGMNVMLGYYKNEADTAEAIDSDGWLHTGDLGTMDKNGNIFIRGRKKTMLLGANGQNIYPEELEAVVNNQEFVVENVVVERSGKLVALVNFADNALSWDFKGEAQFYRTLEDLQKKVNSLVGKNSSISEVKAMKDPFEKTATQKIRRFKYKNRLYLQPFGKVPRG